MTGRRALAISGLAILTLALAWTLVTVLPRRFGAKTANIAAVAPPASASDGRKIKARLFYLSDDGTRLVGAERDVPFAEGAAEQARAIVAAQVAPVAPPLVSAVLAGTTLKGVFITPKGEAYVDLSSEIVSAHPGGTLDELLTIYTIVDALTVNLPAVTSVQLLVNGKEAQTLAGHVDLRRPLAQNLTWIQ